MVCSVSYFLKYISAMPCLCNLVDSEWHRYRIVQTNFSSSALEKHSREHKFYEPLIRVKTGLFDIVLKQGMCMTML